MQELTNHHDGCGLTELCRVLVRDEPHPVNGAHHHYTLRRDLTPEESAILKVDGPMGVAMRRSLDVGDIVFQKGPRDVPDSIPGTLDGAIMAILIHRQKCFLEGPFASAQGAAILHHLQKALDLTIERAQERAKRGVLGKNEK